ncbi:MAG: transketolase [Armatimonadetes bacterium]|nr:transketolase [Armatimonadota bacterium]
MISEIATCVEMLPEHLRECFRSTSSKIRASALRMTHTANASHIGSCLSMADILAVLYSPQHGVLNVDPEFPAWPDRDRFIISKGHGAAGLYAALVERGFFPKSWLDTYCEDGTRLSGHVSHIGVPGVELSTGSLGHGLSVACGMACAAKADRRPSRVVCLLSDGECNEGSIWESVLFAPFHREKWRAFNWSVKEVDGHDHIELYNALKSSPWQPARPSVVIAHTVKGKGVSFMENTLAWHYKSVSPDQLSQALAEVGG